MVSLIYFFFSSRRRHTRWNCDWSSDVCSSDLSWPRSAQRLLFPQTRRGRVRRRPDLRRHISPAPRRNAPHTPGTFEHEIADLLHSVLVDNRSEKGERAPLAVHCVLAGREGDVALLAGASASHTAKPTGFSGSSGPSVKWSSASASFPTLRSAR